MQPGGHYFVQIIAHNDGPLGGHATLVSALIEP
jgi:hypothetical protein